MRATDAAFAEFAGTVALFALAALLGAAWLGVQAWRERRAERRRLARIVAAKDVVARQRQVVADLLAEVNEGRRGAA